MDTINLNDYKKSIILYGKTEEELVNSVKEYEECTSGGDKKGTIKLKYCALDENWIYIDFIYAKNFEDENFWHYQNLLLWLAEGENNSFSFAYTDLQTYENAFYSYVDIENEWGDSVKGIYKGTEFYYEVPGFSLDWLSAEGVCKLDAETLYSFRNMDENLLKDMEKRNWKEMEITVSD